MRFFLFKTWFSTFLGQNLCFLAQFSFLLLTHCFMRFFWKLPIFTDKLPVASSNSYKTMKNAPIVIKLGTNVDWNVAFQKSHKMLNFLLPWQRGGISKLAKILILRWFFSSKLNSKCYNFLMDWVRVKGFSGLIKCYLRSNARPFSAFQKCKIFLGDEGGFRPPSNPLIQGGSPPLKTPLVHRFHWGRRRKSGHFFQQFS